eukprot:00331_2
MDKKPVVVLNFANAFKELCLELAYTTTSRLVATDNLGGVMQIKTLLLTHKVESHGTPPISTTCWLDWSPKLRPVIVTRTEPSKEQELGLGNCVISGGYDHSTVFDGTKFIHTVMLSLSKPPGALKIICVSDSSSGYNLAPNSIKRSTVSSIRPRLRPTTV